MDGLHKYIIDQNSDFLLSELDTDWIKDYLWQEGAIEDDQREQLEFEGETKRRKVEKLLPMLKDSPNGYDILLKSLKRKKKLDLDWIAERLEMTDTTPYKEQQRKHEANMKSAPHYDGYIKPGDVKVYNILSRRPEVIKDWQGLARGLKIKETQIEIIRDKNSRLNDKLYDVLNENSTRFLFHDIVNQLDQMGHKDAIDDLITFAKTKYPKK